MGKLSYGAVVKIVLSKIGGIPLMGVPSGLTVNGMPAAVQISISPTSLINLATSGVSGGLGGLINSVASGVGTNLETSLNSSLGELFQNPVSSYITDATSSFTSALGEINSYSGALDISSLNNILTSAGDNVQYTLSTFEAHTNRISGVKTPDEDTHYGLNDVLNIASGIDANISANLNISVDNYIGSLNRTEVVEALNANLALVNAAINSGDQNQVDSLVANITALKSNLDASVSTDTTNFNQTLVKAEVLGSVQTLASAYNSSSAAKSLISSVTKSGMNSVVSSLAGQLGGLGGGVQISTGGVKAPKGFSTT